MAIFAVRPYAFQQSGLDRFTVADFVTNLRTPTPSAAAELAVFNYDTFENTLNLFAAQLSQKYAEHI